MGSIYGDSPQCGRFTMVNQDEEGVVYTDHSGDEHRRVQQTELQQEALDLNAIANDITGVDEANVDSGGVQNGRPHLPPRPSSTPTVEGFQVQSTESSRSPPRRSRRSCTPPRRRSYHSNWESKDSSSEGDHGGQE
ncbi:hypothetical protein PIB30_084697 [Stylosanthes scabra]|uniref:Uncharacterized protein n=1 Tax=Stylosanthes scabra TaxID=79078 RepID=A0ABU6YUH0_9FABA|nr:hypothetical protein [Stylosanthes scabra]